MLPALDIVQGSRHHLDAYFRHLQVGIQFDDSSADEVFRTEVHGVVGLLVYLAPQLLELLTCELFLVEPSLAHSAGIFGLDALRIEDAVKTFHDVLLVVVILFAEVQLALLLVLVILRCQLSLLGDVPLHAQCKDDILRIVFVQRSLFASGVGHQHILEQRRLHLLWAVGHSLGNLCL